MYAHARRKQGAAAVCARARLLLCFLYRLVRRNAALPRAVRPPARPRLSHAALLHHLRELPDGDVPFHRHAAKRQARASLRKGGGPARCGAPRRKMRTVCAVFPLRGAAPHPRGTRLRRAFFRFRRTALGLRIQKSAPVRADQPRPVFAVGRARHPRHALCVGAAPCGDAPAAARAENGGDRPYGADRGRLSLLRGVSPHHGQAVGAFLDVYRFLFSERRMDPKKPP